MNYAEFTVNTVAKWLLVMLVAMTLTSCSLYGRQRVGDNNEVDLFIFFIDEASDEQIEEFGCAVIGIPEPADKGCDLLPGISGAGRTYTAEGHDAMTIDFWPYATRAQRELVLERVMTSPIVSEVLKDVVPAEVEALN